MPHSRALRVVAIVVAYESAGVLSACLAALNNEGVETIVIDNASSDASRQIAKDLGATVIANPRNEGYGRANNAGVKAADAADFCLIVNPDVVVAAGLIGAMLAAAAKYPDTALFGPRLIEPDGRVFFRNGSILAPSPNGAASRTSLPETDCETTNLSGACLLVRRQGFLDLDGFDDNIFLFYEDDDLCYRASQRGWKLMHVNDATAQHVRGGSSTRLNDLVFRIRYHQAWSRAYVCRKHGKPADVTAMIARNALKYAGAAVLLDRERMARYGGSVAGSMAAMLGRSALKHEGLA